MQITRLTPADAMAYKALMLHAYEHAADSFTSTPQERALQPIVGGLTALPIRQGFRLCGGLLTQRLWWVRYLLSFLQELRRGTRRSSWPCMSAKNAGVKGWPAN